MLSAAISLLSTALSGVQASGEPSILGTWLTDDHKALVSVNRCGEWWCGRISKVLDNRPGVPKTDVNNPEPSLRGRPIMGLLVLTEFRREGRRWTGGRAYDPKTGSSYRSKLELNADGSLKVTGCILFFCQSKRWTRVP